MSGCFYRRVNPRISLVFPASLGKDRSQNVVVSFSSFPRLCFCGQTIFVGSVILLVDVKQQVMHISNHISDLEFDDFVPIPIQILLTEIKA